MVIYDILLLKKLIIYNLNLAPKAFISIFYFFYVTTLEIGKN
jgi:hypothetical protein